MIKLLTFVWMLITISSVYTQTTDQTLQAVQVIFRHGARTPQGYFSKDDANSDASIWPNGFHQLTCIGQTQCYDLGVFLRKRYNGFISESYIPQELYTQSSDLDRTIQSASSVLSGFYPPNDPIEINNDNCDLIEWKPIPVHSIPHRFDPFIRQETSCGRYEYLLEDFYTNAPEMKKMLDKHRDLLDYFLENLNVRNTTDFKRIVEYYDTLYTESYFNMTMPDWAIPIIGSAEAKELVAFYFQSLSYTNDLKQMRSGPILQQLVDNFESVKSLLNGSITLTSADNSGAKPKGRKLNFISGHDCTIASVLNALGVYSEGTRPSFASAVILELHAASPTDPELVVKMFWRNDTKMALPYEIQIPACGTPCHYSKFMEITQPYRLTYDEWVETCKNIPGQRSMLMTIAVWAVILICVVIVLAALIFMCRSICRSRRERNRYNSFK